MTDPQAKPEPDVAAEAPTSELAEDALVEEVSIDGMCGVY